jgi:hypothetical protein
MSIERDTLRKSIELWCPERVRFVHLFSLTLSLKPFISSSSWSSNPSKLSSRSPGFMSEVGMYMPDNRTHLQTFVSPA